MQSPRLITCVMADKLSNSIIRMLQEERGIVTANKFSAKGTSFIEHLDIRQMDVLTVVVEEDVADEVFELLYEVAEINRPHGGMIFQEKLGRCSDYILPNPSDI